MKTKQEYPEITINLFNHSDFGMTHWYPLVEVFVVQ